MGVGVGGGGGSYINEDLATSLRKAVINATEDPQDGSIVYQFINGPTFDKIIRFAKNTNKCIDIKNGGIYAGTNVQMWDCNNSPGEQFVID